MHMTSEAIHELQNAAMISHLSRITKKVSYSCLLVYVITHEKREVILHHQYEQDSQAGIHPDSAHCLELIL